MKKWIIALMATVLVALGVAQVNAQPVGSQQAGWITPDPGGN